MVHMFETTILLSTYVHKEYI